MSAANHLRALQALELAVRGGSLKRAAEQLSITPAAVGQRIRALEDYLGLELLVRGRSGIQPTAQLRKAIEHLSSAFQHLDAVSSILDFQRVDEVHVVADTDWEQLWLRPRLPAFKRENPNILLCINGIGDVPMRLGQEDCRVWFGAPAPDANSAVLFADYLVPISSPENAARVARQPKQATLEGFPLLHLSKYAADPAAIDWPRWVERHGFRKVGADRGLRYRQLAHALEAVTSNAGLLLGGIALILDHLERGEITAVFPPQKGSWTQHAYQVSFRKHAARRSASQVFRAWLLQESAGTSRTLAAFAAGRRLRTAKPQREERPLGRADLPGQRRSLR